VFPPAEETFAALNLTPLREVKVVIVGQDPYHGPGQAHGLCFSVKKGAAIPPSLRNIYKELSNDPGVDFPRGGQMPTHGNLELWAKQGVLLLNAVLTVQKSKANSHKKKGWEEFTDEVIRVLLEKNERGLVFLLWGKPAAKKAHTVIDRAGSKSKYVILHSSHPSPLGAAKTNAPFLGSRCFGKANATLKEMGLDPIDWNVDPREDEEAGADDEVEEEDGEDKEDKEEEEEGSDEKEEAEDVEN